MLLNGSIITLASFNRAGRVSACCQGEKVIKFYPFVNQESYNNDCFGIQYIAAGITVAWML